MQVAGEAQHGGGPNGGSGGKAGRCSISFMSGLRGPLAAAVISLAASASSRCSALPTARAASG